MVSKIQSNLKEEGKFQLGSITDLTSKAGIGSKGTRQAIIYRV